MNEAQLMERADKALKLLNDPILAEGFENTRQAIFAQIEKTPIRDTEGLAQLRLCLKLLNDVRANLNAVVNDGEVANFRIEQEKRWFKLAR